MTAQTLNLKPQTSCKQNRVNSESHYARINGRVVFEVDKVNAMELVPIAEAPPMFIMRSMINLKPQTLNLKPPSASLAS